MVSVIIPTHNRADFLKSSIASVLSQTYGDFEIIVVDDNSSDHTHEVIKGIKDNRIKYIRHRENRGPSAARNTAIASATGEYIAFLDDDDEWIPEKLQKQVGLLDKSKSNICAIYSNRMVVDKLSNQIISKSPQAKKLKGNLLYQLSVGSPIHTSTVIIKKKCIEKIGLFDESMSYMEDRDFWIRLSLNWDFEYIDTPLTIAYVHKQGHLSESLEGQTGGREKLLERYNDLFSTDRKTWSKLHLIQGAQYCQLKNMKKGRKNLLKGIKIYPFNLKAYLHLFSSLLGPTAYQCLRKSFKTST